MRCDKCGEKLPMYAKFCVHCGKKQHSNRVKVLSIIFLLLITLIIMRFIIEDNKVAYINNHEKIIENIQNINVTTDALVVNEEQTVILSKYYDILYKLNAAYIEKNDTYKNLEIGVEVLYGKLQEKEHVADENIGGYSYTYYVVELENEVEVNYIYYDDELIQKSTLIKEFPVQSGNIDVSALVGKKIICIGKFIDSGAGSESVKMLMAGIVGMEEPYTTGNYMDVASSYEVEKHLLEDEEIIRLFNNYRSLVTYGLLPNDGMNAEKSFKAQIGFHYMHQDVIVYPGYYIEDLDADNIPELIVSGRFNGKEMLFIRMRSGCWSRVPGMQLYNLPDQNLFYTSEGYDEYVLYAGWGQKELNQTNNLYFITKKIYVNYIDYCEDYVDLPIGHDNLYGKNTDRSEEINDIFQNYGVCTYYSAGDYTGIDEWEKKLIP